jgi:hypothetical protein
MKLPSPVAMALLAEMGISIILGKDARLISILICLF